MQLMLMETFLGSNGIHGNWVEKLFSSHNKCLFKNFDYWWLDCFKPELYTVYKMRGVVADNNSANAKALEVLTA